MSTQTETPVRPAAGPKLPPYGPSITLAQAKKVAAAALEAARANQWTMVIAVVDPGGHLVYLEKLDETGRQRRDRHLGRVSAIAGGQPKMFQERLARGGGAAGPAAQGAIPVEATCHHR